MGGGGVGQRRIRAVKVRAGLPTGHPSTPPSTHSTLGFLTPFDASSSDAVLARVLAANECPVYVTLRTRKRCEVAGRAGWWRGVEWGGVQGGACSCGRGGTSLWPPTSRPEPTRPTSFPSQRGRRGTGGAPRSQ